MTPQQIREQIQSVQEKAEQDIATLKAQLNASETGISVGDVLKSKVNRGWKYKVTAVTDYGLNGVLSIPRSMSVKSLGKWEIVP